MADGQPLPCLGVVIVAFASRDVIIDCLRSLLAAQGVALDIVVVDNGSPDDTVASLRRWAAGEDVPLPQDLPIELSGQTARFSLDGSPIEGCPHSVRLVETGINAGFAAGVNRGLELLARNAALDRFWILNPDSVVPPGTPHAFATAPDGFALMGGRVVYLEAPDRIQSDGGVIAWATGVTHNINQFQPADAPPPDPARFDFISGASMVASRAFLERAGSMPEEYFLYYEEVAWALRRGDLPLAWCPDALIYHRAGASIGSGGPKRLAAPFSLYFLHRARILFLRRHRPRSLPAAFLFSVAKAGQLLLKGHYAGAAMVLRAGLGFGPPASVLARLSPEAARCAFGTGSASAPGE